jgi:hypothetical protein
MIRFRLQCPDEHAFDAFANGAAFDTQAKRGLIACAVCGSTKIEKALMAPNVGTKSNKKPDKAAKRRKVAPEAATPESEATQVVAANSAALTGDDAKRAAIAQELVNLMRKVRAEVEAKSDYVGRNFAEEARKIHYDEAPNRGIYGEASRDDVVALLDEGIDIMPLPPLPEDGN